MRVAVRERVLDGVAVRTVAGRRVEQRDDLAEQGGRVGHGGVPSIIRGAARRGMGREAHLRLACGPFALLALAAIAARRLGRRARHGAGDPRLRARAPRPARRSEPHRRARDRPPHGRRRLLAQRAPLARAGLEREAGRHLRAARDARRRRIASTPRSRASARRSAPCGAATSSCAATATRPSASTDLDLLAGELAALGITRVTGSVVGDESWFDAVRTAPGLAAAASTSRSRRRSRRSSSIEPCTADARHRTRRSRPPLCSERRWRPAACACEADPGSARRRRASSSRRTSRRRWREIVRFMGRESDNFTAELLVKHLGVLDAPPGTSGTTAAGIRVVRETLEQAGVPLAGVRLVDGSGLSRLEPADRRGGRRAARGRARQIRTSATPSSPRSRSPASTARSRTASSGCPPAAG